MSNDETFFDCIIIGGGPAGLTAATYLGRFLCKTLVIDNNHSRASLIPTSHNLPGFPQGISGKNFLKLLREQTLKYGVKIFNDTVINLKQNKVKIFTVITRNSEFKARYIILAMGVLDIEPDLPNLTASIKKGLVRHCLVCDGYEVKNKKIAILGEGKKGLNEAILLNRYSNDITFFCLGCEPKLTRKEKAQLYASGIKIITNQISNVTITDNKINSFNLNNETYLFDTVYSALGCKVRSNIVMDLGIDHLGDGKLRVNHHQQTSIKSIYAIGDLVPGLNQISVAVGQAAIAATDIFNKIQFNK